MNKQVARIITIAKTVKEEVTLDGQTFYFAAVGCNEADEAEVEALAAKGFHTLTDPIHNRGAGLCWEMGR